VNDTSAGRPKQFLADLAVAMRSAAEAGRESTVEQCRANAETYVQSLRDEGATGAGDLRKVAADDVAVIRDQSRQIAQDLRDETERRIAQRQALLASSLAEFDAAMAVGLERAERLTAAFEGELATFFERLGEESDPTVFASLAAHAPDPPDFGEPDPAALVRQLRGETEAFPQEPEPSPGRPESSAEAAPASEAAASATDEEMPYYWWLDSPASLRAAAAEHAPN
jgi:hypothetical protein